MVFFDNHSQINKSQISERTVLIWVLKQYFSDIEIYAFSIFLSDNGDEDDADDGKLQIRTLEWAKWQRSLVLIVHTLLGGRWLIAIWRYDAGPLLQLSYFL